MMMIMKTKSLQLLIIMMMNGDDDAMHIEYMENKYIYYITLHYVHSIR